MTKHLMSDPAEHQASMEAERAWGQMKKAQARTMQVWLKIGQGFLTGSAWAMRRAGTNQRKGRGYNEAFAEWMQAYDLAEIDQADRSNLFKLMDHPEIMHWRNSLKPDAVRDKVNHPTSILRAYAKAMAPASEPKELTPLAKMTAHRDHMAEVAHYTDKLVVELMALVDDLATRLGMSEEEVRKMLPPGTDEYYKPPVLTLSPKQPSGEAKNSAF